MPPKKVNNKPQWTYNSKTDFKIPENAVGFIYRIDVLDSPFYYYYGKKNLTSTRGRGKKAVTTESAWRNYESSSKELRALIKAGKKIKKEILKFCFSKAELSYEECKIIICDRALEDSNCLNKWVTLKVWEHQLKTK